MKRPLLIGEAPGRSTPPAFPAFFGRERSARRLWDLGFRVSRAYDRPGNVDAINLLSVYPGPKWPTEQAKKVATEVIHGRWERSRDGDGKGAPDWQTSRLYTVAGFANRAHVVLVGRNVTRAFGALESWDWLEWVHLRAWDEKYGGPRVSIMPHPSGLSRWWNDAKNVARAQRWADDLLKVPA